MDADPQWRLGLWKRKWETVSASVRKKKRKRKRERQQWMLRWCLFITSLIMCPLKGLKEPFTVWYIEVLQGLKVIKFEFHKYGYYNYIFILWTKCTGVYGMLMSHSSMPTKPFLLHFYKKMGFYNRRVFVSTLKNALCQKKFYIKMS